MTTPAQQVLQPCPFCGASPKYRAFTVMNALDRHEVTCENNRCLMFGAMSAYGSEISAISAWNTRIPAAQKLVEMERPNSHDHMGLQEAYDAHQREAKRLNFELCGCDYCRALRYTVEKTAQNRVEAAHGKA